MERDSGRESSIYLNGGVYDPTIGRFISADPTVPDPLYSQAFDRYSYVYNRPLEHTDPSGYGCSHYDADGNMTNRNGTAITWNSLNLPTCMDAGGGSCTTGSNWSSFAYAPDDVQGSTSVARPWEVPGGGGGRMPGAVKHRYYQSAEINGVSETTVYSGAFEAWTRAGATTYRYHLMAYGREVAEVDLTHSGTPSPAETVSYCYRDEIGSVEVTSDGVL
ncbi:MAG: RHS repeat-associated core domain-containing protein [Gammaproteobacteria bacterium]